MLDLDEKFAPVTSVVGFVEAAPDRVATELATWRRELYGTAAIRKIDGGLREGVAELLPLTWGFSPRELVIGTANRSWTALLNSRYPDGDPVPKVSVLASRLGTLGAAVMAIPDMRPVDGRTERQGARQFFIMSPDDHRDEWGVSVTSDGGRWRFDRVGAPQPFEDESAYQRRRVADRLTMEMLVQYTEAVGLKPFDETFYPGPSFLVESPAPGPPNPRTLGLEEAQQLLGIDA